MAENKDTDLLNDLEKQEYKYGFTTDIETETIPRGLDEGVVRLISEKKGEPEWMTERRLQAYRHWLTLLSLIHISTTKPILLAVMVRAADRAT